MVEDCTLSCLGPQVPARQRRAERAPRDARGPAGQEGTVAKWGAQGLPSGAAAPDSNFENALFMGGPGARPGLRSRVSWD